MIRDLEAAGASRQHIAQRIVFELQPEPASVPSDDEARAALERAAQKLTKEQSRLIETEKAIEAMQARLLEFGREAHKPLRPVSKTADAVAQILPRLEYGSASETQDWPTFYVEHAGREAVIEYCRSERQQRYSTRDDPQLERLGKAIAQRVGQERYAVWFTNSTRLDLKQDELEIAVPNDFISEWIFRNFAKTIQDAAHEVLGSSLIVRFNVVPQLFERFGENREDPAPISNSFSASAPRKYLTALDLGQSTSPPPLRHNLDSFVVGIGSQLAYNAVLTVAENPGVQYNPLFIHGSWGLGKTHLLQELCRKFIENHPTKHWLYLTGEEFTSDFLGALKQNKVDAFRRRLRDLDLLVIDDVHFMSGKKATLEEFLHTFNAIEAVGKQVVMASNHHPKMIEEFGESLINRFVSGMVVRIDPPNHATRCQILRGLAARGGLELNEEVIGWIARRVTQNVRELEGAVTRIGALVRLTGQSPDQAMVQSWLAVGERKEKAVELVQRLQELSRALNLALSENSEA
jgi:chromosomal replication initiator protein